MTIQLGEAKKQWIGASIATLLGLVLFAMGARLLAYDYLLSSPVKVVGTVVEAGQTKSNRGGSTNFVRYQFVDIAGVAQRGTSRGYSGVVGEGKTPAYAWKWSIAVLGLSLFVVGLHWGWRVWKLRAVPGLQLPPKRRGSVSDR